MNKIESKLCFRLIDIIMELIKDGYPNENIVLAIDSKDNKYWIMHKGDRLVYSG